MIKETYSVKSRRTTLSVTQNAISAISKSDTVKTGIRLYDSNNGCIGVAGAIGGYDENRLVDHAKQMLKFKIPYPVQPTADIRNRVDLSGSFALTEEEFVTKSEHLLEVLRQQYPLFSFNHKITYEEEETLLYNTCGAELSYRDKHVLVQLTMKHRHSKNLYDSFGLSLSRGYDVDDVVRTVGETCACYDERVDIQEGKIPVIMLSDHETLLGKLSTDLHARKMGTGASLFSGKIGEKLFDDRFSLCVGRDPKEFYHCFFDAEGTTLPENRFMLIENGVLKSPYTSKKLAHHYGYAVTGSAAGAYDSVPDASGGGLSVMTSGKEIRELLEGRKAVYVVMAGGGDFTPQGEFASPIQAAFLFDGDRLCGRLPQLSMSSHMYDMFGKDFIGLAADGNSPINPFKYLAVDMQVKRIGDWL